MNESVTAGASDRTRRALLVVLAFALFAAASGTHALTPLFPEFKAILGRPDAEVRVLTSVFTLGYSIAGFVLGVASDRIGRRPIVVVSLLVIAVASGATWFVCEDPASYAAFVALRLAAGLATGGVASAAVALAADAVPFERRGAAMSLVMAGTFASMLLAMPLASALATVRLGLVFPALGLLALLAAPLVARFAPHPAASLPGTKASESGARGSLLAAIRTPAAKAVLAVTFCNTLGAFAIVMSFADAVVDRFGAGHDQRSLLFLVLGGGSLLGVAIAQRTADRFGKRRSVIVALLASLATLPLVLLPESFAGFAAVVAIVAAGSALRQGPFAALLTEVVPSELRGTLLGWNSLFSGCGLALGAWLGGVAYASHGLAGAVCVSGIAVGVSLVVFRGWVHVAAESRVDSEPSIGRS